MTRFLLKRLVWGVITLFLFLTLMFFVAQILMPGDFVGQFLLPGVIKDQMREELGLNLSLWQQYIGYLRTLMAGSLGQSMGGPSVVALLAPAIPVTLLIFGTGTLIAFIFGNWLGKVTAGRRMGLASGMATLGAVTFYTSFPPWLVFLVTYTLGRYIGVFRDVLHLESSRHVWLDSPIAQSSVIWMILASMVVVIVLFSVVRRLLRRSTSRRMSSLLIIPLLILGPIGVGVLAGVGEQVLDIMTVLALPLLTFVLLSFGETMTIMQASMTDVLNESYIETARAKGLSPRVVRDRHAARNALLPALTRLVTSFPRLLGGVVIIEYSFGFRSGGSQLVRPAAFVNTGNMSGAGSLLFGALHTQDMEVVMGALIVVGALSLVARVVLDLSYAYLDPRIRYGSTNRKGEKT